MKLMENWDQQEVHGCILPKNEKNPLNTDIWSMSKRIKPEKGVMQS